MSITLHPFEGQFGAEVWGLDLSEPISDALFGEWRAAFEKISVLAIPGQNFTTEQHVAFSERFGPLEAFPEKDKTKGKIQVYNVANVSPDGEHLAEDDPRVIFQRNNARSALVTVEIAGRTQAHELRVESAVGEELDGALAEDQVLGAAFGKRTDPLECGLVAEALA